MPDLKAIVLWGPVNTTALKSRVTCHTLKKKQVFWYPLFLQLLFILFHNICSKESETDSILGLKTNGQGFVADVPHTTELYLTPLTLSKLVWSHTVKKLCWAVIVVISHVVCVAAAVAAVIDDVAVDVVKIVLNVFISFLPHFWILV